MIVLPKFPSIRTHITFLTAIKRFEQLGRSLDILRLELQTVLGTASTDGDGLSFAQGSGLAATSNKYTVLNRIDDVRDFLNFSGGVVNPGESVTFTFQITDNQNRNVFWLSETPAQLPVPEPETYAMMLAGLGLLGFVGSRGKRKL